MNGETKPPPSWLKRLREKAAQCFQKNPDNKQELTEILRDAEKDNLIKPDALTMMEGALLVSELQVRDIMVPRSQMVVVLEEMEFNEYLPIIAESGHSRFPMMDDKHEHVIGILLAKDMLACVAEDGVDDFNVRDILRRPIFVPESKRLNVLLGEFRRSRNHMAIVIDEYGGIAGLVTIEDVIEQIVGEIDDEHDLEDEEYVSEHHKGRYTLKAHMPLDEFNEYFDMDVTDEENETIGGVIIDTFGHLPKRGEIIEFKGFEFKIIRADRRRILIMRMQPVTEEEASTETSDE